MQVAVTFGIGMQVAVTFGIGMGGRSLDSHQYIRAVSDGELGWQEFFGRKGGEISM